MRDALIVEILPEDLGALSFLAGLLVGMGRGEAEVLQRITQRVQLVQVNDDFGQLEEATDTSEAGLQAVPDLEPEDRNYNTELDEPVDVNTDPTAPEHLGISLEEPNPGAATYTPFAEEGDFGAGPVPTTLT